jgi:hypothetical protein
MTAQGKYDDLPDRVQRWADRGPINDVLLRQVELQATVAVANECARIADGMALIAEAICDLRLTVSDRAGGL